MWMTTVGCGAVGFAVMRIPFAVRANEEGQGDHGHHHHHTGYQQEGGSTGAHLPHADDLLANVADSPGDVVTTKEEEEEEEQLEDDKATFLRPYITHTRKGVQDKLSVACERWGNFKKKTGLDHRWDTVKYHTARYYWLITGHKVGPQVAVAATAGVCTYFVTRKVGLPARLALLSGGIATNALLPPYAQTFPFLREKVENFDLNRVKNSVIERSHALSNEIKDDLRGLLPFGLGKKRARVDQENEPPVLHDDHHVHHQADNVHQTESSHAAPHAACCHDEPQVEDKKHGEHHQHH